MRLSYSMNKVIFESTRNLKTSNNVDFNNVPFKITNDFVLSSFITKYSWLRSLQDSYVYNVESNVKFYVILENESFLSNLTFNLKHNTSFLSQNTTLKLGMFWYEDEAALALHDNSW